MGIMGRVPPGSTLFFPSVSLGPPRDGFTPGITTLLACFANWSFRSTGAPSGVQPVAVAIDAGSKPGERQ